VRLSIVMYENRQYVNKKSQSVCIKIEPCALMYEYMWLNWDEKLNGEKFRDNRFLQRRGNLNGSGVTDAPPDGV